MTCGTAFLKGKSVLKKQWTGTVTSVCLRFWCGCGCVYVRHHHHQSLNREGRWGTTDDFATSFLHFSLFSTALWDLPNSRPVHSLNEHTHVRACMQMRTCVCVALCVCVCVICVCLLFISLEGICFKVTQHKPSGPQSHIILRGWLDWNHQLTN